MANQSITSLFALRNAELVVVADGERRTLDWEVVEAEDLYADVDSLDSFSISSGDEDSDGVHADQDQILGQEQESDVDCTLAVHVLGPDLHRGQEFGDGAFYSADSDTDNAEYDLDVVVEQPIIEAVQVVDLDPLGFRVPHHDQYEEEDEDDNGVESEYEIDVDDELVPWEESVRMRKLGKRACSKMNKSKKMAHLYTKPACLHGKHGLGLKAY